MSKEKKEYDWGIITVIILVASVACLIAGVFIHSALTTETIVVEGTIISAEYIGEEDSGFFKYDIIRVVFDNNETYDLVLGEGDHDFTVHSKLILKLKGYGDDKWVVNKMIKVPMEEG